MYSAARSITFQSSQSKSRIHEALGLTFSPLLTRMNSSMVAQAMLVPEVEGGHEVEYPVPMSPFAGGLSKDVELQRALMAEAAMKSGPAIGKENVLFEDDWLTIVNKPRGQYCEHVFATVPSLSLSSSSGVTQSHLHMANRLDRDTSGILVITKCREAAAKLTRAFTNREVQKTYLTQCARVEERMWRKVRIESGHGRSRYGAWRVYFKHDIGRRLLGGSAVRDMVTTVQILADAALGKQAPGEHKCLGVVAGSKFEVRPVTEGSDGEEVTGACVSGNRTNTSDPVALSIFRPAFVRGCQVWRPSHLAGCFL